MEHEENREKAAVTPAPAGTKRKRKKRRWVRRIITALVILCLLGGAGWIGVSRLRAEYTVTYDPYVASRGNISNSLSFSGSIQLVNSTQYTAPADAKVREVYVAEGGRVSAGDRLLRLSGGETLEAEFDGTVALLEVAKGDEVKSGDALLTVADFEHMKVSVRVGESDIGSVSVGQSCRVAVPSAGAAFESTVDRIDYVAYTGNNVAYYTTTVKVDASGTENIYPGMQATVTVPLEEANDVIVLRMDAVSTARDNTAFVYKESADGTMQSVPVTVGVSNGNYVEIRAGVTDGETVYAVSKAEETASGLAGLLSGMFGGQRVNRPTNMGNFENGGERNWNRNPGSGGSGGFGGGRGN